MTHNHFITITPDHPTVQAAPTWSSSPRTRTRRWWRWRSRGWPCTRWWGICSRRWRPSSTNSL